jgi:hypothetical protein
MDFIPSCRILSHAIHPHAASAATYSDTGTLSSGGTWANTLTFTDPNVTATFDVTNTNYQASTSDPHCMQTDSCGWWGVDDVNGYNCLGHVQLCRHRL